jgi:hypothetical protein
LSCRAIYSVYVWQRFFFIYRGAASATTAMCQMHLFALGNYYLIERPATRFGHRLSGAFR